MPGRVARAVLERFGVAAAPRLRCGIRLTGGCPPRLRRTDLARAERLGDYVYQVENRYICVGTESRSAAGRRWPGARRRKSRRPTTRAGLASAVTAEGPTLVCNDT